MLLTTLVPSLVYNKAAFLAKTTWERNSNLREANQNLYQLSDDEFDRLLQPASMV